MATYQAMARFQGRLNPVRPRLMGTPIHMGRKFPMKRSVKTCFKISQDDMSSAAAKFPCLFNSVDVSSARDIFSDKLIYHTSSWFHDLIENKGQHKLGPGADLYVSALKNWTDGYTQREITHLECCCNEDTGDMFMYFGSSLINTGVFIGEPGSGLNSYCAGIYRLKFGADGKIEDIWLYRSGTEEERAHLLKDTSKHGGLQWLSSFTPYPATFCTTDAWMKTASSAVNTWVNDVWSQGKLSRLHDIVSADVQYYDGVGVAHTSPLVGAPALYLQLEDLKLKYEFGVRVPLALALRPEDNKAFLHWTQNFTHRTTGRASGVSGISLLVMDSQAKITQVLDFAELLLEDKDRLFKERHLVRAASAQ